MKFNREPKIGMRDELFNSYATDIRSTSTLNAEEEREIITRIKNGDESAVNELVMANQRFIIMVARDYAKADNLMDIIQEANMGMMAAIPEYDPDMKTKDGKPIRFLSFAVWYIRREINHYLVRESQPVVKSNCCKTNGKLNRIKEQFLQKEHRYPTIEELKDELAKNGIEIKSDSDLYDVKFDSIDSAYEDDEDSTTFEESPDFTNRTSAVNDYAASEEQDYLKTAVNIALSAFKEREQTIIKMLYGIGYDREYTIMEIADELNISKERVRQLKLDTEKKLKKILTKVLSKAI